LVLVVKLILHVPQLLASLATAYCVDAAIILTAAHSRVRLLLLLLLLLLLQERFC